MLNSITRNAFLTLALLILGGCSDQLVVSQAPSVTLVPSAGQLNLHNTGDTNLQVWGDKLEGFAPDIREQGQIIPRNGFYGFPTSKLRAAMLSNVGHQQDKRIPFEVYLSDAEGREYIATFDLQVNMASGNMTVDTQSPGLRLADGFNESARSN